MKNRIKVIASLLAGSSLWSGNVAAVIDFEDGVCFSMVENSNLYSPLQGYADLDFIHSRDDGNIFTAPGEVTIDNTFLYCTCDYRDEDKTRKWVYHSIYENITPITVVDGTYKLITVQAKRDGVDGTVNLNVGTLVDHGENSYTAVPVTTVSENVDRLYGGKCTIPNETPNNSDDTEPDMGGVSFYDETVNRSLQLVIQPLDNMPVGEYTFEVPVVNSYKLLALSDASSYEFIYPETRMDFGNVTLTVPRQCSFGGNSIYTVDLGAVEQRDFNNPDSNGRPDGYEDRGINLQLECNGDVNDQMPEYYIIDGNEGSNESATLTTELSGVGVVIEDGSGPLTMGERQYLETNAAGELELKAYPVKVGDEPVDVGIYRAKATLVIENN